MTEHEVQLEVGMMAGVHADGTRSDEVEAHGLQHMQKLKSDDSSYLAA
jgi:hypothetical protein